MTRFDQLLRRNSIVRNAVTLIGGAAAGHAITLAITPVLTRLYGPQDFSTMGVFVSVTNFCIAIAALRLDQATLTASDETEALHSTLAALTAGTAVAVIAGLGSGVALTLMSDIRIVPWLWAFLVAVTVWFGNAYYCLRSWQLFHANYQNVTRIQVHQSIGRAVVQTLAGVGHIGVWGLVAGEAAGRAIGVRSLLREVKQHSAFSPHALWNSAGLIFTRYRKFAAFGLLSTVVNTAAIWAPVPLASMLWADPTAGLLTLSQRLVGGPVSIITRAVGDSFHREFTAAWTSNRQAAQKVFLSALILLSLVAGAAALVLIIFAVYGVLPILGDKWGEFGRVILCLLPTTVLSVVVSPLSRVVFVLEIQEKKFLYDVMALTSVVGAFYLAHYLGQSSLMGVLYFGLFQACSYGVFLWVIWQSVSVGVRDVG